MKKIFVFLCALFLADAAYSQTRKLSLETTPADNVSELVFQEGHSSFIYGLKFSSDDKYLFSLSEKQAAIWETKSGKLLKMLNTKKMYNFSYTADFSPDGSICVYISEDNKLKFYSIKENQEYILIENLEETEKKSCSISFAPNGKTFAFSDSKNIYLYDVKTLEKFATLSNEKFTNFFYMHFSFNSKYIVCSASENGSRIAILWDINKNQIKTFKIENKKNENISISRDAKYVAFYSHSSNNNKSENEEIVVAEVKSGKIINRVKIDKIVENIDFSPDGKTLFYSDFVGNFFLIEILSNNIKKIADGVKVFAFQNRNEFLAVAKTDVVTITKNDFIGFKQTITGASKIVSSPLEHSILEYNTLNNSIYCNAYNNGVETSFSFDKNMIPNFIYPITANNSFSMYGSSTVFFNNGQWIVQADNSNNYSIIFYDILNCKKEVFLESIGDYPFIFSGSDDSILAFRNNKEVYVYDVKRKKVIHSYKSKEDYFFNFMSPKQNFLVSSESLVYTTAEIFDIKSGKLFYIDIGSFINGIGGVFSPNEEFFAIKSQISAEILIYDTKSWNVKIIYNSLKKLKKEKNTTFLNAPLNFSSDGKYLLCATYDSLAILDIEKELVIKNYSNTDLRTCNNGLAVFIDNDKRIASLDEDRVIRVYSVETGELLSATIGDTNGDWLTYIPEGYFNGSEGGINKFVHLVNGMEVSELVQYAETLFRPDLVAAKIRGEDISKEEGTISLAELVSTGEAPIVQFTQNPTTTKNRDITVNFSVQDMGGGIGSVYLKLNDKVIQLADGSRKLELVGGNANTSQKSSGKTTQFSHLLSLQNGENTIEAYATNSAGKIESRHAVTKISWQGNTAKPNLYVLAVGVNKYRDKSLWLNYAVPDATSIADSFRGIKGNLYQSVNVTTVFDGDVTSSGIATAFNSIAGKVSADDVFIFYLSGHGTTHTDGDYYFIPVDFRFRNAQSVPETAVSKHFITEQLSKIKAQKTLVMLDTCNSGAFISTGARGMAEKTAIDRLSRATGQATIAASSDTQSAMEGYNGHGIFTYVILEGLSGKADTNKDGYVSLSELSSYAEEKVPDYSYAKWGYEQYPQVDLRKQSNFPLVGK